MNGLAGPLHGLANQVGLLLFFSCFMFFLLPCFSSDLAVLSWHMCWHCLIPETLPIGSTCLADTTTERSWQRCVRWEVTRLHMEHAQLRTGKQRCLATRKEAKTQVVWFRKIKENRMKNERGPYVRERNSLLPPPITNLSILKKLEKTRISTWEYNWFFHLLLYRLSQAMAMQY